MKQVTVKLDNVLFTGDFIKLEPQQNNDIHVVMIPRLFEIGGKVFPAVSDGSVLRISASTLVATAEVA